MTEEPDVGPTAWRVWNALVNRQGLPLVLTPDELDQLTEPERLTLARIAQRRGATITFDPVAGTQTVSFR